MHIRPRTIRRIMSLCAVWPLFLTQRASSQGVVYDNTTTPVGSVQFNGATTVGGNTVTNMIVDDLTLSPNSAGATVTGFTFDAFYAASSGTVVASSNYYFWAADGAGGGPGTFLYSVRMPLIQFTAQEVYPITTLHLPGFTVPSSGKIWAGVSFDNFFGGTSATAAQLNQLGGELYNPPTLGSSQDGGLFGAAGGYTGVNNPTLTSFNFNGNPVVNLGWQLQATGTPEPGPMALGTGIALLGSIASRRRRR